MTPEELAIKAEHFKNMFECGNLGREEFKELVNDLIVTEMINNEALQLEENITTRKIIVGVIDFAKMLA
jgi:hypothetical protein